ncbi:M50 family metallopeptidase, partial [Staphylococcus aureus]|uniref:M50 family metallopeptidase n=1 Tax=Staphylococcus aureus TaxID=1280 RepID=UPI0037540422
MELIQSMLSTSIYLNIWWVVGIAVLYIVIHQSQQFFPPMRYLDIYMNYIPVLTHEFGHVLFNRISGGRAEDFVIVVSPSERY